MTISEEQRGEVSCIGSSSASSFVSSNLVAIGTAISGLRSLATEMVYLKDGEVPDTIIPPPQAFSSDIGALETGLGLSRMVFHKVMSDFRRISRI